MKIKRFFSFLLAFLFLASPLVFARGAAEPSLEPKSLVPRDPKIITGVLDNGLSYYIRRNVKPENRMELRLVVGAGSVLEDEGQEGLAHFVEHMAFNGTRSFAGHEMVSWLESIGMRFGPDTNAYTSFDETVYQLTVPTDNAKNIETAFLILEEWLSAVSMEEAAIEKERGIVLEEWRLSRRASSRVQEAQFPVLLQGSRYAVRQPIGKPEVIKNAPKEEIVRFYRDWYRPELSAIVAVGDFNPDEMETLIRRQFSRIPSQGATRARETFSVPRHEETLVSVFTDPELGATSIGIYAKKPMKPPRTNEEYRKELAEELFFFIVNERFRALAQRPGAPFLSAYTGASGVARFTRLYYAAASVSEGGEAGGLAALVREMKRIQVHGFTETEIERARTVLLRDMEQTRREAENVQSGVILNDLVDNFLEGWPMTGIEYGYLLAEKYLPDIGAEELKELAQSFLLEENRVVLVNGPSGPASGSAETGESEPIEPPAVLALVRDTAREEVDAFQDEVSGESLLEEPPQPGTAKRLAANHGPGSTEWKLGNGIRVVLKTTDYKNDEILMSAFSPGGTSLASDEDYISADFAENAAQSSGVGPFSAIQLEKYLSGRQLSVTPRIMAQTEGFQGFSSREDLETFFELVYAYFTRARLDEEAMSVYLKQVKTSLLNREKQPETLFYNRIREIITREHPRNAPLKPAAIDKVDMKKAFEFYTERFGDAGDFTFIFVGSLSADELEPYLEKYLASLPSSGRREEARDTGMRLCRGEREEKLRAGLEQKSLAALFFTGDFVWSQDEVFRLGVLSDYLDLRLREILREDKGGTYGVSVSGDAYRFPAQEYSLGIYFGASPEKVEELASLTIQSIAEMKKTLPEEADAVKLREQAYRQHERMIKENSYWLARLRFALYNELPVDNEAYRLERIKTITPAMIQDLIRTYCNAENLSRLFLLPAE